MAARKLSRMLNSPADISSAAGLFHVLVGVIRPFKVEMLHVLCKTTPSTPSPSLHHCFPSGYEDPGGRLRDVIPAEDPPLACGCPSLPLFCIIMIEQSSSALDILHPASPCCSAYPIPGMEYAMRFRKASLIPFSRPRSLARVLVLAYRSSTASFTCTKGT